MDWDRDNEGLYDLRRMIAPQVKNLYRERAPNHWRQWRTIEAVSQYTQTRNGLRAHEELCMFCGDAFRWNGERGLRLCGACRG